MSVVSTDDVSCNGGNNGSATVSLDGGTNPVTYTWDNGVIGNTVYNLTVGSYTVTAVDANGCTANTSVTISEPTAMNIEVATVDAHCGNSDGSAQVIPTGGVSPYNYLWSDGSTNDHLNNLPMGIYIVTVTDATGCQQVLTNVVNNSDAPNITILSTDVSCNGGNNGTLTSYVTGGTQPYTYNWSTGDTEANIENLQAGDYILSVTDANNCTAIANHKVMQPDVAISVTSEVTPTSCKEMNDGEIQLDVEFGTEPYVFNWSTGETTDYLDNIKVGSYIVTVTDANSCETTDSIVVTAVKESCLHIYNTLTPNGDGKNDTWIIDGIENFPNCSVKIFNQWGNLVYEHEGYYENWDGTKNGKLLPAATYYYILDLGTGEEALRGDITIISAENRAPQKPKTIKKVMRKGIDTNNNSK
jgi:gliding motility-associated-like protein